MDVLLIILILLALLCFGLGFAVKWLFIAAVILVVLAILSHFRGRSRL